jgi:hypothetical protein
VPLNDYGTVVVTMLSTFGAGGYGSRSVAPDSPVVIDNATYAYAIQWNSPGSNGALMGVKLAYALP